MSRLFCLMYAFGLDLSLDLFQDGYWLVGWLVGYLGLIRQSQAEHSVLRGLNCIYCQTIK